MLFFTIQRKAPSLYLCTNDFCVMHCFGWAGSNPTPTLDCARCFSNVFHQSSDNIWPPNRFIYIATIVPLLLNVTFFVVSFIPVPSPPLTALLDALILCMYKPTTPGCVVPCSFRCMNCFAWPCYSACEARTSAFPALINVPLVLLNFSIKHSGSLDCDTYFPELLFQSFDSFCPLGSHIASRLSLFTALLY